ncbi:hypothetical protein NM688_g6426 [Phlebia brevispora]|uniref:Uncharacterized protein n=1 Tax=Phlebia brevispora TaxID=194682 RepID=A0ACC1SG91_9APHY|nr:hypothetical protein NM688_g6426 [Phlebia brevispora]
MTASVPRDIQAFLDDYPNQRDDKPASANLEFYSNHRRCRPDNMLIDEIHQRWFGDYNKLERKHGFIQWLFPIRELGVNYESQPLQKHEREAMKTNEEVVQRVIQSYRLMLDFYGMQLESTETGLLARVEPESKNAERYANLNRSFHNYLRISRILKSLSEMGLERLNAGFLLFVLNEQSEHNELYNHTLADSMDRWWANCIRNEEERVWIASTIRKVRQGASFTRAMYEQALERRKATGSIVEKEDDDGTTD